MFLIRVLPVVLALALCAACGGDGGGKYTLPADSELKPWVAPERDDLIAGESSVDEEEEEEAPAEESAPPAHEKKEAAPPAAKPAAAPAKGVPAAKPTPAKATAPAKPATPKTGSGTP